MRTVELDIRASILPTYIDCARMAASKQVPKLLAEAGYGVNKVKRTVGAAIGTANHAGVHALFRGKTLDEARKVAYESYEKDALGGLNFDDTTAARDALDAIDRMLRRLRPVVANMEVQDVERRMVMRWGEHKNTERHIIISGSGTMDWRRTSCVIGDLKTGRNMPHPQTQIGFYSLLARSNKLESRGAESIWLPRVGPNTPIKDPVHRIYDLVACEQAAAAEANRFMWDLIKFVDSGNPAEFQANPNTLNCSSKFCPVWGTPFCTMGKPE